jgi:hypothetical protein
MWRGGSKESFNQPFGKEEACAMMTRLRSSRASSKRPVTVCGVVPELERVSSASI